MIRQYLALFTCLINGSAWQLLWIPLQMQWLEIKAPSFCLICLMLKLYLYGSSCHTLASTLPDAPHTPNPTIDSSFPKYITHFPIVYFTLTELPTWIFHFHIYG